MTDRRRFVVALGVSLLITACSATPGREYVALRDKIADEVQALVRDAPLSDVAEVTRSESDVVGSHIALLNAYALRLDKLDLPAGADEGCRQELMAATWKVVDSSVRVFYDKRGDLDALIETLKLC
jgi:hypothetical protein